MQQIKKFNSNKIKPQLKSNTGSNWIFSRIDFSNAIYRDDRPSNIYWAGGPVQGCLVVRGWLNAVMEVYVSE